MAQVMSLRFISRRYFCWIILTGITIICFVSYTMSTHASSLCLLFRRQNWGRYPVVILTCSVLVFGVRVSTLGVWIINWLYTCCVWMCNQGYTRSRVFLRCISVTPQSPLQQLPSWKSRPRLDKATACHALAVKIAPRTTINAGWLTPSTYAGAERLEVRYKK